MSCAKIGSSAVAEAKNVAKKSSSIVERMSGALKTNCSPSFAAAHDTSFISPATGAAATGRSRIIASARMTKPNDRALKK